MNQESMKTKENGSGQEPRSSEIDNTSQRTLEEVLAEIQDIITNTHRVETRLAQLEARGYQTEDCWVKNGSIGTIWYMKRKQVYRIQVTDSEPRGDYHKAFCVVISFNDLSVQISELAKMRNSTTIKRPKKIHKYGL